MTLRLRILAGVAVIIAGCLAVAFVVIYRETGAQLRGAIDEDLRGDAAAFTRAATRAGDPYARARSFIAAQPFRGDARLLFARFPGRPTLSNEPELLAPDAESAQEARLARALLESPVGFSTAPYPDVGDVRLLVRAGPGGARFGVGEALQSLDRARDGVGRAFVLAGSVALAIALLAGAALSVGLTRRLRRMAAIADRIDEGDLAPRMDLGGPRDEVHHLAVAFDTMLARLGEAFDRQAAFAAEASHELRTPLTVIRGQLEVLARDPDPSAEDVRHVERLVTAEVRRMSTMVDDLLVLAAPTVQPRPVHVPPLLASLLDGMRTTAERAFRLGRVDDVTVSADPDRLAQVLRNLLRNAVEHTAPGGTVELSAAAGDGLLRLAVDDDGPGIPEAERELVFDRFHRAAAPRRAAGGAGLGLAIVRALAEAHGGRAWAEASPLGGARVAVELPLRRPEARGARPGAT